MNVKGRHRVETRFWRGRRSDEKFAHRKVFHPFPSSRRMGVEHHQFLRSRREGLEDNLNECPEPEMVIAPSTARISLLISMRPFIVKMVKWAL